MYHAFTYSVAESACSHPSTSVCTLHQQGWVTVKYKVDPQLQTLQAPNHQHASVSMVSLVDGVTEVMHGELLNSKANPSKKMCCVLLSIGAISHQTQYFHAQIPIHIPMSSQLNPHSEPAHCACVYLQTCRVDASSLFVLHMVTITENLFTHQGAVALQAISVVCE